MSAPKFVPLPNLTSLPVGWHVFNDGMCLGALGVTIRVLQTPERMLVIDWTIPESFDSGVTLYADPHQIVAEADGDSFWAALATALSDWCGEMPAYLRARLMADVAPLAMADEAMANIATNTAPGGFPASKEHHD